MHSAAAIVVAAAVHLHVISNIWKFINGLVSVPVIAVIGSWFLYAVIVKAAGFL